MENNEEFYAICDIDNYASEMREIAAKSLSEDCDDNLDDYISIKQIINLINSKCIDLDENDRPIINEDINEDIYESIVIWIHNVGLAKLAANDLIQCAWDDKLNEMIFWAKSEKTNEQQSRPSNKRSKR